MRTKRIPKGAAVACQLCGAIAAVLPGGRVEAHACAPIAKVRAMRAPRVELDMAQDDGLERAKRFFFEWQKGARVTTDHDITYVCEDVDDVLAAGSVGTIVRRVMVGLYVVRWDAMPAHELQTSADCLLAVPS